MLQHNLKSFQFILSWLVLGLGLLTATCLGFSAFSGTVSFTKNNQDLLPGDTVLAQNPETGKVESKKILEVYKRVSQHLRLLTVRGANGTEQTFETTDEHPFWVVDTGWVDAGALEVGQILLQSDGQSSTVAATHREERPEGVPVYNFQVEDFHTYFVAAHGTRGPPVLSHNSCDKMRPDPAASGPHTTFRRDGSTGKVVHYQEWKPQSNPKNPAPWESVKRVDVQGDPHFNEALQQDNPTPHVHDSSVLGGVRPATASELPK